MKSSRPLGAVTAATLSVLARWALGGLYVYMGLSKALEPVGFLKLVRQYRLVSDALALNLIAAVLPWFEVCCGLLLVLGVAVRGTALVSALMLPPFTLLVLRRALELQAAAGLPFCAVKFDCGCGAGEVFICWKLAENTLLFVLSLWLIGSRSRALCLRHGLFAAEQPAQSSALR